MKKGSKDNGRKSRLLKEETVVRISGGREIERGTTKEWVAAWRKIHQSGRPHQE